jgi:hypothetical protein
MAGTMIPAASNAAMERATPRPVAEEFIFRLIPIIPEHLLIYLLDSSLF